MYITFILYVLKTLLELTKDVTGLLVLAKDANVGLESS